MKKSICMLTILGMMISLAACAAKPENNAEERSSGITAESSIKTSEESSEQSKTESSAEVSEESSIQTKTESSAEASEESSGQTSGESSPQAVTEMAVPHREGYTLEQVLVLSRHNIRSPLSVNGSLLDSVTPYKWYDWSSNPSELSLRGGILETETGQYFRKWLESENLFPENYHPEEGAVRIYANSLQRTTATANFFKAGLLPTADTQVETHMNYDEMDPVFEPRLTFATPRYKADAEAQIREMYTDTVNDLADNYVLITDVIDMKNSEAWKDGTATELTTDDMEFYLQENKEPGVKGSMIIACSASDALILQYYEEADKKKAAFGHDLTDEQWAQIAEIKDVYGDVLFSAPLVAANVAHPLLQEIEKELNTNGRKFTFLCGHDSNICSVLAALNAEAYELPGSIERKTPIGSKVVFCRWKAPDGSKYCTADLVYQSANQLRNLQVMDLSNHPAVFPIRFSGINSNADGLYSEKDFMNLLRKGIQEYDNIKKEYSLSAAA